MKYCINARHVDNFLKKADEIYVEQRDHMKILDYIELFPEKTIILEFNHEEDRLNLSTLQMYNEKLEHFVLAFKDISLMDKYTNLGFNCYWTYQVHTFYELNSLLIHRPCYIQLGEPLSFSLDKVKKVTDIPLRLIVNMPYEPYIPRMEGICGQWVRPEDIELYSKYIDVFCFQCNYREEETLFKVYAENKTWPGNLNLLITNLGYDIDNRLLESSLAECRMNCGQKCQAGGACRRCQTEFHLADAIRKLHDSKINETSN